MVFIENKLILLKINNYVENILILYEQYISLKMQICVLYIDI